MKEIPLRNGGAALVDDEDFELVNEYSWYRTNGYAYTTVHVGTSSIAMHQLILPVHDGLQVDHVNGERADNRKANLRPATSQQQKWNMGMNSRNTSGYKGVAWHGQIKRWVAYINKDRKRKHLGTFDTKEEAAHAYDRAALELFGEFARTNFRSSCL